MRQKQRVRPVLSLVTAGPREGLVPGVLFLAPSVGPLERKSRQKRWLGNVEVRTSSDLSAVFFCRTKAIRSNKHMSDRQGQGDLVQGEKDEAEGCVGDRSPELKALANPQGEVNG